jgi:hypothetical protein
METPIEILKHRLDTLKYMANTRGFSSKKKEARQMIPQFEIALQILECALEETSDERSNCNIPHVSYQLPSCPNCEKTMEPCRVSYCCPECHTTLR